MRNDSSNENYRQQNVTLKPGRGFVDDLVVDVNIKNNIGFPTFRNLRRSENDGNTQAKQVPFLSKNGFPNWFRLVSRFFIVYGNQKTTNTQAKRAIFLRIPSLDNRTQNKTVF